MQLSTYTFIVSSPFQFISFLIKQIIQLQHLFVAYFSLPFNFVSFTYSLVTHMILSLSRLSNIITLSFSSSTFFDWTSKTSKIELMVSSNEIVSDYYVPSSLSHFHMNIYLLLMNSMHSFLIVSVSLNFSASSTRIRFSSSNVIEILSVIS